MNGCSNRVPISCSSCGEVESDWESSSDDARSGTEVSTDSEFAHDDPTLSPPPYAPPRITINDEHETDLHNYPEPAALFGMVKVCITGNDHNTRRYDRLNKEEIKSPQIVLKEPIKRPTEFSLSRTRSTSGIAAKRALELKKKYLLGDQSGLSIQKSDSASQLDSKFKSFQSNISEFQKLLNPGSDISPCMQAFLANSSRRNFPTSPSTSMFMPDPFKPEKEVEEVKLEPSIITEPMPDIIQNLYVRNNNIDDNKEESYESKNLVDLLSKHNLDIDTNADPVDLSDKTVASDEKNSVLEQQLIVPDIDRDTRPFDETHSAMESDIESDSLLDSDNTEEVINEASPFVPRVEVHDETGALMQPDSLMMVETENVQSESPDEKVENVCESTNEPVEETQPNSYQESDESANDVTALALTETELSDWAIDAAALEDYEDEDLKICSSHKNLNRLKKTKDVHKTKNITEAQHTETPHVCGKDPGPKSMFAKAEEEFDFMDMGSQDSLIEATTSTTNVALLKNRGFLEFVDVKPEQSQYPKGYNDLFNSENITSALRTPSPVNDRSMNFIEQPVCTIEDDVGSTPTAISDQLNGSNDTPTSTSAEDSPEKELQDTTESSSSNNNEPSKAQDSVIESTTDVPLPVVEFEKKFRIDPVIHPRTCQNISDLLSSSSDMHYYSKSNNKVDNVNKDVKMEKHIETNLDKVKNVTKSPQTARRVEEIMKEKVKQKDLVREMVMDRLLANRLERRSCKRNRQSPDVADTKALKLVGKDNTADSMAENKETRLPDVPHSPGKLEKVSFADSKDSEESVIPKSKPIISKVNDVNGRSSSSAIPQLSRSRTDSDVRLNLASGARSKPYTYEIDETQVSSIKLLKHASGSNADSPPSPSLSEAAKPNSMSDPNIPDSVHMDAKKTGKERRRSIIRTVSEFFNKRLSPKTKEVSKSCYGLEETYDFLTATPQKCQSEGDMQYMQTHCRRPERCPNLGNPPSFKELHPVLYHTTPTQKRSNIPPLPQTIAELEDFVTSLEKSLKRATLEESEQETFATWFAARAKLASLRQSDQVAAAALADSVLAGRQSGLVDELRRARRSPEEEGKLVGEILAVAAQRDSLAALYEKNKSRTIKQKGCRDEK